MALLSSRTPARPRRRPRLATALVGALVLAAGTALVVVTAPAGTAAPTCGTLFDDFSYSSRTDPAVAAHGWRVRTSAGGPGVGGARWSADNVTFETVDGQRSLRLRAATDGTAAGTSHAEFSQQQRRFREGTYLARIRFADVPESGTDGDHVNQTFYSISPLARAFDPTYSELDFAEYLPNGGWGTSTPTDYVTSWYTYQPDPWVADNQSTTVPGSLAGWHDVMATVGDGTVRYYVDGRLVGTHSGKVYPRQDMSIDFNQWFIDLAGHRGGTSVWRQSVDYVLHAEDQLLTPAQASAAVASLRQQGLAHVDTIGQRSGCSAAPPATTPGPTPTASTRPTPTPSPTSTTAPSPSPSAPTGSPTTPAASLPTGTHTVVSDLGGRCLDVPAWDFSPGVRVVMWACDGESKQRWRSVGRTLRTQGDLCLDVAGAATANGTPVQIARCNGNPAQDWVLGADRTLRNPLSGRCLDIEGWRATDGARLVVWDCHGGANQRWRLV